MTHCLWGPTVGLNCHLPSFLPLSASWPHSGGHWHSLDCVFPSHHPRRGPIPHLAPQHVGDFMTWTVSTSTQPALHTVTPWPLSPEAALPESLSSRLLTFLPSVSTPLKTVFQAPRTSRSMEHSFFHQPCLMQLHLCGPSFHQLSCQHPELPHASVFSGKISTLGEPNDLFSPRFYPASQETEEVSSRKWWPLLICGPYEALPSDPATSGWSLTTLYSLNPEPMRCLSVSHLIFIWWSCFYITEKVEAIRGGLLQPPVTKFTRTWAHLSLFLQKRVTVLQPGASELPGGQVKTCFLDSESRVLTITWGNFTIPEEEHGHSIKDVVRETPLQMLGKKWDNTWNSWSYEQNKMISKQKYQ